jgi:hypothetical protein
VTNSASWGDTTVYVYRTIRRAPPEQGQTELARALAALDDTEGDDHHDDDHHDDHDDHGDDLDDHDDEEHDDETAHDEF